jgi:DNA-binding CsgD family transcriptional regulator
VGSVAVDAAIDLWAPVSFDDLPRELVDAVGRRDWPATRASLGKVMDGAVTDGAYGRALLQLVMTLPFGVDPLLDRYRAVVSIDYGDWDNLRTCLAADTIGHAELVGMREILLAPIDSTEIPAITQPYQAMLFGSYEYQFSQMLNRFRRWAKAMLRFQATEVVWSRPDVPAGRHFRYRKLQDAVFLALAEAQAGSLSVASALALEAQRLGDETEPLRRCAADLEELVALAMGDDRPLGLRFLGDLPKPTGSSPLGTSQLLNHEMPLLALGSEEVFERCVDLTGRIAVRLGSPRAQLLAASWHVASDMVGARFEGSHPELPALLAQAAQAGVGLRVLPQLLHGITTRKAADLAVAEASARRSGQVWAQVTALTWMAALNPTTRVVRWLGALLDATSWRRPSLVPAEIAADAALGLASAGRRSESLVEFASAAGRPNVLLDVALRQIDDTAAPLTARTAAVEALGTLGTARAHEVLGRLARHNDELARRARLVMERRRRGVVLSEREMDVVRLAAEGLTNRDIAERLSLSPHTIARHLANARAKLGAANRTEAAVKLEELEGTSPRLS